MVDVLPCLAGFIGNELMIYQLLGLVLFIIGCTHLSGMVNSAETKFVQSIQIQFQKKPWLPFFQEIWFFGRTSFTLVTLLFLTAFKWELGATALLVFLVIVGIEQIVKIVFKRDRPFISNQEIRMLQPVRPHDPSFPSGDALRIWYLAIIIPVAAGGTGFFLPIVILLATLVSLGRTVMGVHYPADTIAGAGLGLLAAGTTHWLWQYLSLL